MNVYISCIYNYKIIACMYMHSNHIILHIIKFAKIRIFFEYEKNIC